MKFNIALLSFLCLLSGIAFSQTEIQAEDAYLFSAFVRQQYSGYTGAGYVDVVDKTGAYLEFAFRRNSAAMDTVTMFYANGGSSRNFNITINDVASGSITLTATGGWTTWSSRTVVLAFQAGVNRVRFTATTNGGYPNVDRIVISGQSAVVMYKLTLVKSGSGTISASPASTYYDAGASVELTATASGNSFFKRWMGAGDSPASPYNLTMNGHKVIVGVFLDTTGTAGFPYQATSAGFSSVNALGYNGTTGGADGDIVTVTTGDELWSLMLLRADASRTLNLQPLTVYVPGILSKGSLFGSNKMLDVKDAYNISIIGVGNDATITGFGLLIVRSSNIIVRNIQFASCPDDGISIQADDAVGTGHHIWIDHCTFTNTPPSGYPAAGTFDGSLDITHTAEYVTASWNHFIKHDKNCLLGHSDNQASDVDLKVTYHHNYFDSTIQRNPRVRFGKAHVFNNYYRKNQLYGVSSNLEADVLVEGNYFQEVPIPTETSRDGSPPGDVVERNNIFVSSGVPGTRGTAFEASTYYSYSLDSASLIPAMLTQYSGSGKYDFSYSGTTTTYTLTVNATNGTVEKNPDQPSYTNGTNVELTATPSEGYYFVNWSGDVVPSQAANNPLTVTMDGNKTITANFTNQTHTLTVNAVHGSVTKDPDLPNYPEGSGVQLTATPAGGYFFINWSGDVPAGHESDNPLTITMTANKTLTANFSSQTFSLTLNASNGTVTKDPNQAAYDSGSVVQLTAFPATGYHFVNWSGDTSSSSNPLSLIMNGNKNVTANFAINQYTLNITALNGVVSKNPNQTSYDHGTNVTLTATPNSGYTFSSWSGDASGTSNQVTIAMNDNKNITANFSSVGSVIFSNRTGGGDWSNTATWQGGTVPTTSHNVFIVGGDSVFNASAVTCTSLTVQSGGKLSTTAVITVSGVFALEADAWYYHTVSGTVNMPGSTRSFDDASTVVYNYSSGSNSFSGGTFGNLMITRTNLNTKLIGAIAVNGNLTIACGNGSSGLRGSIDATSLTHTVHGNVYITGGTLSCLDNGSGGAVGVWNIDGDVLVTGTSGSARLSCFSSGGATGSVGIYNIGGNLSVTGGKVQYASNATTTATGVINLSGNFNATAGSVITDNGSTGGLFSFNFVGSGVQTVGLNINFSMVLNLYDTVKTGSTVIFNNGNYTWGSTAGTSSGFVVNGSLELMGNSAVTGVGMFTLNPGAVLKIGSADGIASSGATGNIQVTGARTFSADANYEFNGSVAQATGNGFPATVNDITITNADGVSLSSSSTVNGTLSLINGDLDLNGNTLTLGSTGLLSETPGNTVKGTSGVITTTRTLNAPSIEDDVAGLGVRIGSSLNLGSTVITRGHAAQSGIDSGSINRYFDIAPTTNTGLDASLIVTYDESELNGMPESTLLLFKSTNGGASWTQAGGMVNTTENSLALAHVNDFSRWTASKTGGEALFLLNQASLNFGDVTVNQSGVDSVMISNNGTLPLTIDSVRIIGGEFTVDPMDAIIINPATNHSFSVSFAPTGVGPQTGKVVFYSNAASSPDTVSVEGNGIPAIVSSGLTMKKSWNLISLPLSVADGSVTELFPSAISSPYSYLPGAGYVREEIFVNNRGYWLKFPGEQNVSISGVARTADTVQVLRGWNMIGAGSFPVDTSDIVQSSIGLVRSLFYTYDGIYVAADSLQPGKGYWVKVNSAGSLILPGQTEKAVKLIPLIRKK